MFWSPISQLTPEQETHITQLQTRWRAIAVMTHLDQPAPLEPIIAHSYQTMGQSHPQILHYTSPFAALSAILTDLIQQLDEGLIHQLELYVQTQKPEALESEIARHLLRQTLKPIQQKWQQRAGKPLKGRFKSSFHSILKTSPKQKLTASLLTQVLAQCQHLLGNQRLETSVLQQFVPLNAFLVGHWIGQLQQRMQTKLAITTLQRIKALLLDQRWSPFVNQLGNQIRRHLFYQNGLYSEQLSRLGCWLDICISTFHCAHASDRWQNFQALVSAAGWIFPYENLCIVCDRPIKFAVDEQYRPHAEGGYALLYGDGKGLYFNHGRALPTRYGKLPPHQWQAEWVVEERNAELRRLLIQTIGYERICQELGVSYIDEWKAYSLIKVDSLVDALDGEALTFVKMTCPSTQMPHIIRVPPHMDSARAAIRWVNWGVDPEQFAVES